VIAAAIDRFESSASWTMNDEELVKLDAASAEPRPYLQWAQSGVFAERNPKG
jgi:hypothetical protein